MISTRNLLVNLSAETMSTCVPGAKVPETQDYDPYSMRNHSALALPRDIPTWEIVLKLTFYSIAFLIDVFGNSIVVLIILINKKMRNTTNLLILNLAISDIMVGAFCMWVHAGNSVTKEWPFGNYVCKVNVFIQVVAVTSSILTLTAISVERFFAIIYPLKRRRAPHFTAIVITVNWIVAVAMASPLLVVRRRFELYWADRHQVWCEEDWPKVFADHDCIKRESPGRITYYTIVVVVMYFIPIVVMLCTYSIILIKLVFRKRPGTTISASNQAQFKYRKKVIRMLVAVLAAFIICWTPQQTFILWDIYRDKSTKRKDYVLKIQYAAVYIAYCNSALNPILYGGFNENFRKGFKDAFRCLLFKKRNSVVPFHSNRAGRVVPVAGSVNTTPMGTSNM